MIIEIMGEQEYSKRELDAKFQHTHEHMQEGFKDIIKSIESLRVDHLNPILVQTKLTNGRVNGLETRESERRGAAKWIVIMGTFVGSILVSYLAWLGLQVVSIHSTVQQAVTDALIPYANTK
jgi:hypothetical protein